MSFYSVYDEARQTHQNKVLVKIFSNSVSQTDDDFRTIKFPESIPWRRDNSGLSLSWVPFERRGAFLN